MLTLNPQTPHQTLGQFPIDVLYHDIPYYVTIDYDLGGFNQVTGQMIPRGYYLTVAHGNHAEYNLMTNGGRFLLNAVNRQSPKQAQLASRLGLQKLAPAVMQVANHRHAERM